MWKDDDVGGSGRKARPFAGYVASTDYIQKEFSALLEYGSRWVWMLEVKLSLGRRCMEESRAEKCYLVRAHRGRCLGHGSGK